MKAPDQEQRTAPTVEVSWGEVVDKLTILEIKEVRLTSKDAVANVQRELAVLRKVVGVLTPPPSGFDGLKAELKAVNESLWVIEDEIRIKESQKAFDARFIELARSVYFENDKRARIKRDINVLLKSALVEEKQYVDYGKKT